MLLVFHRRPRNSFAQVTLRPCSGGTGAVKPNKFPDVSGDSLSSHFWASFQLPVEILETDFAGQRFTFTWPFLSSTTESSWPMLAQELDSCLVEFFRSCYVRALLDWRCTRQPVDQE